MTIGSILRTLDTLSQLEVLARADRVFVDRAGRYYGGVLTDSEIERLLGGLKGKR